MSIKELLQHNLAVADFVHHNLFYLNPAKRVDSNIYFATYGKVIACHHGCRRARTVECSNPF